MRVKNEGKNVGQKLGSKMRVKCGSKMRDKNLSDQMSQRSQVSKITLKALIVSLVRQSYLLSCSGQLKS